MLYTITVLPNRYRLDSSVYKKVIETFTTEQNVIDLGKRTSAEGSTKNFVDEAR